ncbi:sensor histidine kinase [Tenacibaculum xiamenense]|uniref:sensor histidine kinase n=1 Tax=Tenacibaculum xiamenense TaxID=1261553 RepID=UPI003896217C
MMQKLIISFSKKVPLHILFWGIVWGFFYLFFSSGSQNHSFLLFFSIIMASITIVATYVFISKLIPDFLLTQKYWQFALYTVYTLIFTLFGVTLTIILGFTFFFNLEYQQMPVLIKNPSVISICVLLIITLVSGFKILMSNYRVLDEKQNLKNKFLETQLELKEQELKFLKMQIHPHFLFNTLNTLYGFALKKADEAPDMILRLSNLLDYILYQVEKPLVPLSNEVEHIEDYITLEKMRFQENLKIQFLKEVNKTNIEIAPMLLLPFVENAFKHGVPIKGVLSINIRLEVNQSSLYFEVKNSAKPSNKNAKGIGLENIKKRLFMLYKDKYSLNTSIDKQVFSATLTIPLKNEETS